MLAFIKACFNAIFVNPAVRASFWSVVAVVLSVQLPEIPDGAMPQSLKVALSVVVGVMIPHIREFAKQKATFPSIAILQYPDPRDPASSGERK